MRGRDIFKADLMPTVVAEVMYSDRASFLSALSRLSRQGRYVENISHWSNYRHLIYRWRKDFLIEEAGFFKGMFVGQLSEDDEVLKALLQIRNSENLYKKFSRWTFGLYTKGINTDLKRLTTRAWLERGYQWEDGVTYDIDELPLLIQLALVCGIFTIDGTSSKGAFGYIWGIDQKRYLELDRLIHLPLFCYLPPNQSGSVA